MHHGGAAVIIRERMGMPRMQINSTGLQPEQPGSSQFTSKGAANTLLSIVSLRCVECDTLYAAVEAGGAARYRCDCGGVLDVEMNLVLHKSTQPAIEEARAI